MKEITAHFPESKVFSFEWIDQFAAITINGIRLPANNVALLSVKPCQKHHVLVLALPNFDRKRLCERKT